MSNKLHTQTVLEAEAAPVKAGLGKPMTPAEFSAKRAMTPAPKDGVKGGKGKRNALVEPNSPAWNALPENEKRRQAALRRLMELKEAQREAEKKLREELSGDLKSKFVKKAKDPVGKFVKTQTGFAYDRKVTMQCVTAVTLYVKEMFKDVSTSASGDPNDPTGVFLTLKSDKAGAVNGKVRNWTAAFVKGWIAARTV